LFDHHHFVRAEFELDRDIGFGINGRAILYTAGLRSHLGDDLAELGEKLFAGSGRELDGGDDVNHFFPLAGWETSVCAWCARNKVSDGVWWGQDPGSSSRRHTRRRLRT